MANTLSSTSRPKGITRYSDDGIRRSPLAKRAQKAKLRRQEKAARLARLALEKAAFDEQYRFEREAADEREADHAMAFSEMVHYDICPPPGASD